MKEDVRVVKKLKAEITKVRKCKIELKATYRKLENICDRMRACVRDQDLFNPDSNPDSKTAEKHSDNADRIETAMAQLWSAIEELDVKL